MKIGIIDNDTLALEALATRLNYYDKYNVNWTETSGKSALHIFFNMHKYVDVILIDMNMEDISGAELCRSFRKRSSSVGIVAITSFNLITYKESAIRNGAQAIVSKSDIKTIMKSLEYASKGQSYPPQSQFQNASDSFLRLQHTPEPLIMLVTLREAQILDKVVLGMTNKEIAKALGIGEETVKTHIKSAMHKIGAANRVRASILWSTLGDDYFEHYK